MKKNKPTKLRQITAIVVALIVLTPTMLTANVPPTIVCYKQDVSDDTWSQVAAGASLTTIFFVILDYYYKRNHQN